MDKLPVHIRRAIGRYKPFEAEGATFYPILMSDYDDFMMAKPAFEFMQQRLEPSYISLPLLQAFYKLDMTKVQNAEQPTGLFCGLTLFLVLALRLAPNAGTNERTQTILPVSDKNDVTKLKCLQFIQDGQLKSLTPIQFQRLRPALAAQNGIRLEPDDANPAIVDAALAERQKDAPNLEANVETLVSDMAALTHESETALYQWPIARFFKQSEFYKRFADYIICALAEAQGGKWKNGNPTPSPWFEKVQSNPAALISMDEFTKGRSVTQQTDGTPPVNFPKP